MNKAYKSQRGKGYVHLYFLRALVWGVKLRNSPFPFRWASQFAADCAHRFLVSPLTFISKTIFLINSVGYTLRTIFNCLESKMKKKKICLLYWIFDVRQQNRVDWDFKTVFIGADLTVLLGISNVTEISTCYRGSYITRLPAHLPIVLSICRSRDT